MEETETPVSQLLHNGELLNSNRPVIAINDGAILRGQGIFETLAVYHGEPFALHPHYLRLNKGAERLDLIPPAFEEFKSQSQKIISANRLENAPKARLRVTLTAGSGITNTTFTTSTDLSHSETATVITLPFARNEKGALTGIKTINYGENVVAARFARKAGTDDALFGNSQGQLCEGIWSNVFVQIDGQWITPPLESGCLPGVTRETILDFSGAGFPVIKQSTIELSDLISVEAAFLTSSIREIQPITAIDGREIDTLLRAEISQWQQAYREQTSQKE
tara:strand:+ start:402 stop:1238 length:837 start_codon:yes stop_codon:yes gene_type:complete